MQVAEPPVAAGDSRGIRDETGGVGAVDERADAALGGELGDAARRQHPGRGGGDLVDHDQASARGERVGEALHDLVVGGEQRQLDGADGCSEATGQTLRPHRDRAVALVGHEDLVAALEVQGVVDDGGRGRGVGDEDAVFGVGAHERCGALAGLLHALGDAGEPLDRAQVGAAAQRILLFDDGGGDCAERAVVQMDHVGIERPRITGSDAGVQRERCGEEWCRHRSSSVQWGSCCTTLPQRFRYGYGKVKMKHSCHTNLMKSARPTDSQGSGRCQRGSR